MSLVGQLPSSIFNISSLKEIRVYNNNISGSIPSDMCDHLHHLQVFEISINKFFGHIPSNIGECKNLQNLSLSLNQLDGFIPSSIGNLTNLKVLYLDGNSLHGKLHSALTFCFLLVLFEVKILNRLIIFYLKLYKKKLKFY